MKQPTFLGGLDPQFIESLYRQYCADSTSVDASWKAYFNDLDKSVGSENNSLSSHKPVANTIVSTSSIDPQSIQQQTLDSIRALMLIHAYRVRGHLLAKLDPLNLQALQHHHDLDPGSYGFTSDDYDRPIFVDGALGLQYASLRDILTALQRIYTHTVGVEFMHMQEPTARTWIQHQIEKGCPPFSAQQKIDILSWLTKAEAFEKFLAVKYPGAKRFGLEGGESMIPALASILSEGTHLGLQEVVLGMAHRGRLNVVANILGKDCRAIFSAFQGKPVNPDHVQGSGDVKYHLGASNDQIFNDQPIHLSLASNPSHLEAVNPIVMGKVRAKQTLKYADQPNAVLGVLIHGDAAFAGQGLVCETLLLSDLDGYRTHGTIHIIINNQIGFTTSPGQSRSSPYSSDNIKAIQAPVFHVNGDDPEAVVWMAQLAAKYRFEFQKDVLIDLFCYRRHGHNEMDEPSFTQPLMYQKIRNQATTRELYMQKLVDEGVITATQGEEIYQQVYAGLQQEFDLAADYHAEKADWLEGAWSAINVSDTHNSDIETGIDVARLQKIGQSLSQVPAGFNLNSKLDRLMQAKQQMLTTGEAIDWATAEALAFGSLLMEGLPVRLSGQDCGRGTFSHRHAVLTDQQTGQRYVPLNHIADDQACFEIIDSPLAEASVLGFDLGYSLADPHALVLWEAQFGDFANGAQVIIDQFIASGEVKWLRMSGLVMLLPHSYEGQGPEHSSARLERYLQLCAEDNMQVANCTTAANYFHILRRQLKRTIRKPLIIMTPKSLLRDLRVMSALTELGPQTQFAKIIPEVAQELQPDDQIKRVILCSGKIYYELDQARSKMNLDDVVIMRIEQLYPFPAELIQQQLQRYLEAQVIWAQEEPKNMGAWTFVAARIEAILIEMDHSCTRPVYHGRLEAAATATGSQKRHEQEQQQLVIAALQG